MCCCGAGMHSQSAPRASLPAEHSFPSNTPEQAASGWGSLRKGTVNSHYIPASSVHPVKHPGWGPWQQWSRAPEGSSYHDTCWMGRQVPGKETDRHTLARMLSCPVPRSSSGPKFWLTSEQKLWQRSRISLRQWKA